MQRSSLLATIVATLAAAVVLVTLGWATDVYDRAIMATSH